jgi:hypothetical protein
MIEAKVFGLFVKSCGWILTQNEGASAVDSGFVRIRRRSDFACESGMLLAGKGWRRRGGGSWSLQQSGGVCLMHIGFLISDPLRKCAACSAIRMRASLLLFGAQKNDL